MGNRAVDYNGTVCNIGVSKSPGATTRVYLHADETGAKPTVKSGTNGCLGHIIFILQMHAIFENKCRF